MPENIIIHGASGFLGKHLVKKLIKNNTKHIIVARENSDLSYIKDFTHSNIKRYKNSITEIELNNIDNAIFFDLAWSGVFGINRNDDAQITDNIPNTINSIKFAKNYNIKHWVGIGSQAEYGNQNKILSENDACNPTTLYGKSKVWCSNIANELCNIYNLEFTWFRIFSIYGPDDNHEWFIHYLIKKMLNNETIDVTKAEQCWDYLYIEDAVNALLSLSTNKGLSYTNLASGSSVNLIYIIEKLKEYTQTKSIINYGAVAYREDQVMLLEGNIKKLKENTSWSAKISIDEGLKKTVEFYI